MPAAAAAPPVRAPPQHDEQLARQIEGVMLAHSLVQEMANRAADAAVAARERRESAALAAEAAAAAAAVGAGERGAVAAAAGGGSAATAMLVTAAVVVGGVGPALGTVAAKADGEVGTPPEKQPGCRCSIM